MFPAKWELCGQGMEHLTGPDWILTAPGFHRGPRGFSGGVAF